jgi:hypothetical protein
MKTTLNLPADLVRQVESLAAARGQTLSELIAEGLRQVLPAPSPSMPVASAGNGQTRAPRLSSKAAQWLAEWRASGREAGAKVKAPVSAARLINKMRR